MARLALLLVAGLAAVLTCRACIYDLPDGHGRSLLAEVSDRPVHWLWFSVSQACSNRFGRQAQPS